MVSLLSVLIIALGLGLVGYTLLANRDNVIAQAPRYQESLLAGVQKIAVWLRLEAEPTWTSLRRDLFAQMNLQRVIGSAVSLGVVDLRQRDGGRALCLLPAGRARAGSTPRSRNIARTPEEAPAHQEGDRGHQCAGRAPTWR